MITEEDIRDGMYNSRTIERDVRKAEVDLQCIFEGSSLAAKAA